MEKDTTNTPIFTKEQIQAELQKRKASSGDAVPKLPSGSAIDKPVFTKEQIIKELKKRGQANTDSEFTKGLKRGVSNTAALVTEGVPGVTKSVLNDLGEAVGFNPSFDPTENLKRYQSKVENSELLTGADVKSYKDVHGIADAGKYVASSAGEVLPSIATSLLGGGVGSVLAKEGVKTLARKAGTELTKKQLEKAAGRGILGGAVAASMPQNTGETYLNLLAEGEDEGVKAIGIGALKTGLDILPEVSILKKVLGPEASSIVTKSILKRAGYEGGKAALQEGATESAQEGLDILAEHFIAGKQLDTPENIQRLIDSGLKGAIGGGAMGAGASLVMKTPEDMGMTKEQYDNLSPDKKAALDAKFEEQVIGEAFDPIEVAVDKNNPSDDSIVTPVYVPDKVIDSASNMGVQKESLANLSPEQVVDVQESIAQVMMGERDINTLNVPNKKGSKSRKPREATGESSIKPPSRRVKVTDNTQLDSMAPKSKKGGVFPRRDTLGFGAMGKGMGQAISRNFLEGYYDTLANGPKKSSAFKNEKTFANAKKAFESGLIKSPEDLSNFLNKKDSPTLPPIHKASKPRYKDNTLSFDDDVDKAIYIVGNKNTKSKSHDSVKNWLKDKAGVTEEQIDTRFKKIKETIANTAPDANKNIRIPMGEAATQIATATPDTTTTYSPAIYGNLQDDLVVPTVLANNLEGIEMTQEAKNQFESVMKAVERIVQEVAGPAVKVRFMERLRTRLTADPAFGAQYMDTVYLAMNDTTLSNLTETAYHEAWHMLERSGMFSLQDIEILEANMPKLSDYMMQDGYLSTQDFDMMLSTPTGREELRANAFGKWAVEQRNKVPPTSLPMVFRAAFRKVLNFIEKLGNAYKGMGFKSFDDVFKSAFEGELARDTLSDSVYTIKMARMQRMTDEMEEARAEQQEKEYKNVIVDARIASNKITENNGTHMGFFGRYLQSFVHQSTNNRFIGEIYDSVRRRLLKSNAMLNNYMNILGDSQNIDRGVRYRIHELANQLRASGQKAKLDAEGYLTYTKNGNTVRLNDKEISRHYLQIQQAYAEVLNDWEKELRNGAKREFKDALPENFTMEDIVKAQAVESDQNKVERLGKLFNQLDSLKVIRSRDYVPHMRFGSWGITVRDKDGEQVAFYTVENGDFKGLYNQFQLKEIQKELQDKYSDSQKYDIIGDKGKITNISSMGSIVPFKMTHSELRNNVDPRFLNVELLSSLLNSKDIDMDAYQQLRDEIYNDVKEKGFSKKFSESKQLDGFSRDWDRAMHAYFSGASHYMSGLEHNEELSILKTESKKLKDNVLKDKVDSYLTYTNSPAEDFQMLRTFNFLWTMGGNLSTAMLQAVTLPTATLSTMTQYNPSFLDNARVIGKWLTVATKIFNDRSVDIKEGVMNFNTHMTDNMEKFVKEKTLTRDQADFLMRSMNNGVIQGFFTQEYSGYKPYETRSKSGTAKERLSNVANKLGLPISTMEMLTRFISLMSSYDIATRPEVAARAKKVLANDQRFQAQVANSGGTSFAENLALFNMDEAHAVFGKLGRVDYQRGWGGALFMPFMTYPHQMLELVARMGMFRGTEGKKSLLLFMGMLFFLGGLTGLPGSELIKEIMENLQKQITGVDVDYDLLIREKIYDLTGNNELGKLVTQGAPRVAGLDLAKRIGLPVPGQDIVLALMGIKGDATSVLGVQGSLLTQMGDAWNNWNTEGAGSIQALQAMLPVSAANVLKGVDYQNNGVKTKQGNVLLSPDEVKTSTSIARALGFTTDQVASRRESAYWSKMNETKYDVGINRLRSKAKKISLNRVRAMKEGDYDKARALQNEYRAVIMEVVTFAKENGLRNYDVGAFNRSVTKYVKENNKSKIDPNEVRKHSREDMKKLNKVLGIE